MQSHEQIIKTIILSHLGCVPRSMQRITIGICNEVYVVALKEKDLIVRLSQHDKYLMGSHDHIPQLKALGIKVPDILLEDYSRKEVQLAFQIQSKIEGQDLGVVIETLSDLQLIALAKEIADIFNKIKTIPTNNQFGVIWGGGDNELSDTWTERMKIWIDESNERGKKTGIMDKNMSALAENLYARYKPYFDSIKPVTYYGDICSKNVMIYNGVFNGLVDLDGLTQGDPLEALGRIKLSWYGTHHGNIYSNAVMDEMNLNEDQKELVTMYALLNQISWACENGIQFNQNTHPIISRSKQQKDKALINAISEELKI